MVLYLPQEGRGIGLANKVAAYALQEAGLDTVDANRKLGLPDDARQYGCVKQILEDLSVPSIKLMTNNPRKIELLEKLGVSIVERLECASPKLSSLSRSYLDTKIKRMGHMLAEGELCVEISPEDAEQEDLSGDTVIQSIIDRSHEAEPSKIEEPIAKFASIEEALKVFAEGGVVVVMDDESRENEGDLIMAASKCTKEQVAFFIRYSTGILCAPMTKQRALELELPPMVVKNGDPNGTAFTVTCDSADTTTGVSARDRMTTFHTLANGKMKADSITRPGHIFPLVAKDGGVLVRGGHTESGVDLCKLALPDEEPVALIAELANDDGEMMRLADCDAFAKNYKLPLITVEALEKYLKEKEAREGVKWV